MATERPGPMLLGEHPSMVAVRRLITRVAGSRANNILIYGETGTGKGLAARMIHLQSARAQGEFIDINCAAIPTELLESELLGRAMELFPTTVVQVGGRVRSFA